MTATIPSQLQKALQKLSNNSRYKNLCKLKMNKKTKILNCQEPLKINTEGLGLGFGEGLGAGVGDGLGLGYN